MYFLFFILGFLTASILLALYILLSQNTETKQRIKSKIVKSERAVLGKIDRLAIARRKLQENNNLDIDDLV